MASKSQYALVLLGTGPGIGQAVASTFAAKRYNTIALVARRQNTVDTDRKAVEAAAPGVKVHTYTTDVADKRQLQKTLDKIDAEVGTFETLYYNPAIIRPSTVEDETEEKMIYDFKITNTALLQTAQWALPKLTALAKSDTAAKPSFLATGTWLSRDPYVPIFPLSLVKAAQRNLLQSLAEIYGPQGVHVGVVRVMGVVAPDAKGTNPGNIAEVAYGLLMEEKGTNTFEVEVN